jgi:hypothetical protein
VTRAVDLTGLKFGRLTIISRAGSNRHNKVLWNCRCECGKDACSVGCDIRDGKILSCGCLHREISSRVGKMTRKHGLSTSSEYFIWYGMHARCSKPSLDHYKYYGGKGVKVCDRWNDFTVFYSDMGPRPSATHSLDRKNNDGHYEPGNVVWADKITQANNRRTNRIVDYRGASMTVAQAVRAAGSVVNKTTALHRLNKGWDATRAVETAT